jgi:pimeloyl-ACP methyl ester carboxylesterase
MKPRSLLALAIIWALGMSRGASAADFLATPDVRDQLDQIEARAAEIKPAVPAAPAAQQDAPVDFQFDPEAVKDKDAVVLSVCGLDFGKIDISAFQEDMLLWYYHRLHPGRSIDEQTQRKIVEAVQALRTPADLFQKFASGTPGDYLGPFLRSRFSGAGKNYLVVSLPWTRDPQKSDTAITDLRTWMAQVYAAAQKNGKPVYVVAHSWGTLLALEALESLAQDGSPVRVEKFVTLGSPMTPNPGLLKLLLRLEKTFQGMKGQVAKPANVGTWLNFWAQRDLFSSSIPAADGGNFRVDAAADPLVRQISSSLLCGPQDVTVAMVAKDWSSLNDMSAWHESYMDGFHHFFPSIRQQVDIEVFGPDILPGF